MPLNILTHHLSPINRVSLPTTQRYEYNIKKSMNNIFLKFQKGSTCQKRQLKKVTESSINSYGNNLGESFCTV